MCLAQGHNAVMPRRLEPTAPRSGVKHSTTEPMRSSSPLYNTPCYNTVWIYPNSVVALTTNRPGAKYIEKNSNTLQLLSLINDYNYITIAGHVEM